MPRFFNTAGPCNPNWHYTVDPLPRLSGIRELIDGQHYFVIHAPRQTGKTTYLYALMHAQPGRALEPVQKLAAVVGEPVLIGRRDGR